MNTCTRIPSSRPRLTIWRGRGRFSHALQVHFIQGKTLTLNQLLIEIDMAYTANDFTYEFSSIIRGHHVYKSVWTPSVGETLPLRLMLMELLVRGGVSKISAHVFARAVTMGGAKDLCAYKRYVLNNECKWHQKHALISEYALICDMRLITHEYDNMKVRYCLPLLFKYCPTVLA